ncbi:MAG: maltose ABC transporter permease MalF [Ideonella sp.]|nr:maltose ABC transporter permease MalF [Ideonella sp.]
MNALMKHAWLRATVGALSGLVLLWGVMQVYASGQTLLAVVLLACSALALWTYTSPRTGALRYVLPGIATALLFVIFPMVYTLSLGFTNYSMRNLLDFERAREVLLEERLVLPDTERSFSLHPVGAQVQIRLAATSTEPALESAPLTLSGSAVRPELVEGLGFDKLSPNGAVKVLLQEASNTPPTAALPLSEVVKQLDALRPLKLTTPSNQTLSLIKLREFAQTNSLYQTEPDGTLKDTLTGTRYAPNPDTGFFTSAEGERLQPGYRVNVGWAHYARLVQDERFREPFFSVFVWTVVFSGLTVVFATALGLFLAVLLNWEPLEAKGLYRVVLFLPYAVPGFISILIFKGLFNQNLGEINLILNALFGIKPAWFSDPLLAKTMLLIVNVWLGFPYMMVLCTGLIKAIPSDLYEASAVAGAGPWMNFHRITLPLILKPLTPLLISAFAFNFNNFVLISLLTNGRPDQLDATTPAGTTDILVSYTWRIAFQDSGQQFGLASAISTVIFLLVAAVTLVQMKFTKINDAPAR